MDDNTLSIEEVSLWLDEYKNTQEDKTKKKLKELVVLACMPIVQKVARSLARRSTDPVEDIIQVGSLGLVKAIDLYKKAASYNWPNAQNNLGNYYYFEVNKYKEAIEWYKKAADNNIANSLYMLGICYQYGIGTDVDNNKAFSYYEKACTFKE